MPDYRPIPAVARRDLQNLAGFHDRRRQPKQIGFRQAGPVYPDALEEILTIGVLHQPMRRHEVDFCRRSRFRSLKPPIPGDPFAMGEIAPQRRLAELMNVMFPGGVAFKRRIRPKLPATLDITRPDV